MRKIVPKKVLLSLSLSLTYFRPTTFQETSVGAEIRFLDTIVGNPLSLEDALALGSADLRFTFTRNNVDSDIQALFFTNKVTSIQKFSTFFRSEADLIDVLKDSFQIDSAESLEKRSQVASTVCAWKEAQTKMQRQAEMEAEMSSREFTKPILTSDYISIRNAFMKLHGMIEDKVTLSKEYLEKKLQELEWKFRLSAHKADEVTTARASKAPKIEGLQLNQLLDDPPPVEISNGSMGLHSLHAMFECWSYAMALNDMAHLANEKKYFLKFMGHMTAQFDPETGLRPPTIVEAQAADKALVTLAFQLTSERGWSLDNALHEVTHIRADMSSLLQQKPA